MTNRVTPPHAQAEEVPADVRYEDVHVFSVDVEEWFQVGAFEKTLSRDDWPGLESRVEHQCHSILSLLSEYGVKATFFCLGWVAERHPLLISAIHKEGHEVACHGMDHERIFRFNRHEFHEDVGRAKGLLEDAMGAAVSGYRAPSFSLTADIWWAYEVLEEAGFTYSSSLYPLKTDHYGMPNAPRRPFWPIGSGRILEVPMTVCKLAGRALPASGGGYFRLLPYQLGEGLLRRGAAQTGSPGVFYMHPWEIDPGQPFIAKAPWLSRFRHYTGQRALPGKLRKLCARHSWKPMRDAVVAPIRDGG
ncbi:XrtA system polysaccharide deacetylase [Kordiimonas aestuarii]|uniref:XrtA system polysaccharide deacetylase n=1 Tax=Kordiimonas aestuarii TaxID=1005925 RepID=UPI0021D3899E|nr:XrtA system polysaccharide deacetylase [Kordiimonas aestuarii]